MTDINELAQRDKFEAWFVNDVVGADVNFPAFKDGEYTEGEIYDEQLYFMLQAMWMAWKAAGAELVEAPEKAQTKADVYDMLRDDYGLREKGVGLVDFVDWQAKRIAELESRTVTVKLPDPPGPMSVGARTVYFGIVADVVGAFQDGLNAAGIKVEAE